MDTESINDKLQRLQFALEDAIMLADWEQVNKLKRRIDALKQQLEEENPDEEE